MFTIARDAMSNATTTTSINPTYVDLRDDYMTEQEWHEECRKHKNARKDLVRLWFLNKFGSARECAKHLQCAQSTVTTDAQQLVAMGELTSEHYQLQPNKATRKKSAPVFTGFAKDTGDRKSITPVENSSTEVSTPSTISPEVITDDQFPERVQRCDTMGRRPINLSTIQPTMGTYSEGCDEAAVQMDPNDSSSFLARDWHNVQESNASDSFKRAHELLCEFELLLGQSDKDGWTPAEFYQLATTLDSYHRSCSNCSAEYREELRQYGAARCASIERTLEGDSDAR